MSNRTSHRRKSRQERDQLSKNVSTLTGFSLQQLEALGGFAVECDDQHGDEANERLVGVWP